MTHTPQFAVLSVMGPHAGETAEEIFKRKIDDLRHVGSTFWVVSSYKAKPNMVQAVCSAAAIQGDSVSCFFLEPSSHNASGNTKSNRAATEYSSDRLVWNAVPSGLGPVTGRIAKNAGAMIFDKLELVNEHSVLDLWDFADFSNIELPIIFARGPSTFCAIRKDTKSHPLKMMSHSRRVLAVGNLVSPYGVWLR